MLNYQPDPYRWMIQPQGLAVDGEGRIWVRNGTVPEVIMDVYSSSGDHLGVVQVQGVSDPRMLDFLNVKAQQDKLLVYSLQAPDYPILYIVDIPDI